MSDKIINHEQSEYWNEKYGRKWVDNDNSMNERLSILTKELFLKTNIKSGDKVLDIVCGGGQASYDDNLVLLDRSNYFTRHFYAFWGCV